MSTLRTYLNTDAGSTVLTTLNSNESNLNTDKQEKGTGVTGNIPTFGASNVLGDSGKVPPTGVIVGTTDTQTLTNKTINVGSDLTGDILARSSGGAVTRIAPGASGTTLVSNGVGVLPSFQNPSGATSNGVQNQTYVFGTDTGSANAYVITLSPIPSSYATGQRFAFKAVNANTTASTLNVNSLGAIAIKKNGSLALASGDISAGMIVEVEYDGTNFQMINQVGNASPLNVGFNVVTSTHDVSITGAQTIAHGLGVVPKQVRITGSYGTGGTINISMGEFGGSNQASTCIIESSASSLSRVDTGIILRFSDAAQSNYASAVLTLDGTNLTLTWSKAGSPVGTANLMCSVAA